MSHALQLAALLAAVAGCGTEALAADPYGGPAGDYAVPGRNELAARLAGDGTNATATLATTGLSLPVVAGLTYSVDLVVMASESVAAEGIQFDFAGGTATSTDWRVVCHLSLSGATAFEGIFAATALNTAMADASLGSTNTALFECHGTMTVLAAGTLVPRYAQASHTSGTVTIRRGSRLHLKALP